MLHFILNTMLDKNHVIKKLELKLILRASTTAEAKILIYKYFSENNNYTCLCTLTDYGELTFWSSSSYQINWDQELCKVCEF